MSAKYCNDLEGWGPVSQSGPDLTPCAENTLLWTVPGLLAIVAFSFRLFELCRKRNQMIPHPFKTWPLAIYGSSQLMVLVACAALVTRAIHIAQSSVGYSPAAMLATATTLAAWLLVMALVHMSFKYAIRSESVVFAYYLWTLPVAALTIRTSFETSGAQDPFFISTTVFGVCILIAFVAEAWPRGKTRLQLESHASQYEKSNLFGRVWFFYIQDAISQGYKRPLYAGDVADRMPNRIKVATSGPFLDQKWKTHLTRRLSKAKKPNLIWLILTAYGWQIWGPILLLRLLASVMSFVPLVLLNNLLQFIDSPVDDGPESKPLALGILLAFGMFFGSLLTAIFEGQFLQTSTNLGIEVKAALISLIYQKSLKISPSARAKNSDGSILNHASIDAERWAETMMFLPMWLSIPFEVLVALWLLYLQLGWSAMAGLGVIILVIPFQLYFTDLYASSREKKLAAMDSRIKTMSEVLSSMKIVKLYAWEQSFHAKVSVFRNRELSLLRKIGKVFSMLTIMFTSITLLMSLATFSLYAYVGGPGGTPGVITSQVIFVSVSLFGMLNRPIGMLSGIAAETVSLYIGSRRIEKFLMAEELLEDSHDRRSEKRPESHGDKDSVILVENCSFSWEKPESQEGTSTSNDTKATIQNISISIQAPSLTAVCGRVGQGKSSLLHALIGDMYLLEGGGQIRLFGRVGYVPQQPWILNASLRDNIVFGLEWNQTKYDQIIAACGLLPDIAMLPGGDSTEIGERGINLSGGQRQRVSLARAVYQDADIYLLDDCLSAVDAHVDQHLWTNVIGPHGLLSKKTTIFVTHGLHHLSEVDQVILIDKGRISESGRYEELIDAQGAFSRLIRDYTLQDSQAESITEVVDEKQVLEVKGEAVAVPSVVAEMEELDDQDRSADLIEEETQMSGSIPWSIYRIYGEAATWPKVIVVAILFVVQQTCQIATNLWLQHWTEIATNPGTSKTPMFLGVYAALIGIFMCLVVTTSYLSIMAGVRASDQLHQRLLDRVLRLPMAFFDTSPAGRILNRFSSDMTSIDEKLPWSFHDLAFCSTAALGTIVVIAAVTPVFIAILPPVLIVFFYIQRYYIASSRSFKRIESVARSPLYQHLEATLAGSSSIRALRLNDQFSVQCATYTDSISNSHFVSMTANRWLNCRLEALGSVIVLGAALFSVLGRKTLDSSMVGLALSYALNVTQDVTWAVRNFIELQRELVCVERVKEYSEKREEAPVDMDTPLPDNWPSQGQIEFRNYSTRYREGLELVVTNLNFSVNAGEKVGIVGRTGAGKSSVTLALFRIIEAANSSWAKLTANDADFELCSVSTAQNQATVAASVDDELDGGSIWVDGVDISTVGLKRLRQSLAIIPQDPTLVAGTVRHNLDPFGELQDVVLWEALERAHLKTYISSLENGLSFEITPNGSNLSAGQRSLICLARALLRKTKILVLDEATSATDVQTDELIQATIRKEFKDRTILTIAHRIRTVMDSDRILVLEKGRLEEFSSPQELLDDRQSLFYKLAEQAGEISKRESE